MKTYFTAGPWRVFSGRAVGTEPDHTGGCVYIVDRMADSRFCVAAPREEQAANARLIAGAPDLYHACDAVADVLEARIPADADQHDMVEVEADELASLAARLRRAIAKAEGLSL